MCGDVDRFLVLRPLMTAASRGNGKVLSLVCVVIRCIFSCNFYGERYAEGWRAEAGGGKVVNPFLQMSMNAH